MNLEENVIGCCLLGVGGIRAAAETLDPKDFASPHLEDIFRVMVRMAKEGAPIDPFTVEARAIADGVRGLKPTYLYTLMSGSSSAASAGYYADMVKDQSIRRQLHTVGAKYQQSAANPEVPTAKTLADMLTDLKAIRDGSISTDLHALTLQEILDLPESADDWIVPRLLQRKERLIITGWEGLGKTTWIRQMSICMAAGINPVTLDHTEPVRVLVVDVENTYQQWRDETRNITKHARKLGTVDPSTNMRVHCGGRMDVRKDRDLGLVHRLVDEHEPDVLFIGPIYKLVPNAIQNDDDAAPLITALDSLRDRGLALVMEAHATKAAREGGSLAPRGSNALTGWPEFGFGLAPAGEGADIQRWRGDRSRNRDWPKHLYRGGTSFPWMADNIHPDTRKHIYGVSAA